MAQKLWFSTIFILHRAILATSVVRYARKVKLDEE